jgi:hypothetical protein
MKAWVISINLKGLTISLKILPLDVAKPTESNKNGINICIESNRYKQIYVLNICILNQFLFMKIQIPLPHSVNSTAMTMCCQSLY